MKEQIIEVANTLVVERGFNAFSYKSITEKIDIKTSSIHYHFPTKTDLGIAIVRKHLQVFEQTIVKNQGKAPLDKLGKLFFYYKRFVAEQKVCIIGALTSDINTLEEPLRQEVLLFAKAIVDWVTAILEEGQAQRTFKPLPHTALKAKQIMANLMALAQVARLEQNSDDFDLMTQMILDELVVNG